MFAAIIGALLPFAIQLATYFITKSNLSVEQKKAYLEWVQEAGKDLGSVKLHNIGKKQMEWLNKTPFKPTE